MQSKPSSLATLRIQFKDYAHWYNQMLHGEGFKESKEFWSSKFTGKIPRLNLSGNGPRKEGAQTGKMHNFVIDETLTGKLRSINSKHGNSLFVTLLSSIYVLLYRFTGQSDIVVGTPVAGREHPDLAKQIGLYLNVLPIRNTLRDDMNFSELLNIVKGSCLDAFANQQYPVNYIIRDAGLKRSSPENPLFDVGFVLQEQTHLHKEGDIHADIATLKVVSNGTELNGMVNDLWFSITNNENRTLIVSMHYKPDRLDRDTIENLADGLIAVISAVGQRSHILFGDIELAEKTADPLPEPVSIDLAF
jgi:non-ribosomal peptide synthetase component F